MRASICPKAIILTNSHRATVSMSTVCKVFIVLLPNYIHI